MPDTSSTTTFRADISSLKAEMQAAARAVKVANSEFKAATAGMDDWSSSADGLEAKIKQLQSVLKAQTKQVELSAKELEKTEQEYGKNSAEADRARIKYNSFKAAAAQTEKELSKYEGELKDVDSATEEVEESTDKASDGFTVMKGVLADLAASAIKAGIKGLKELGDAAIQAYEDFDEGYDNIVKATGATGQRAEQLRKSYKNVTKSVIGDFSDIGSALGEVNTRFGFTDEQLETATEQFVKFADITGTDATSAVRLVSRAMGDAGIDAEDYAELLDVLAAASQKSGISVDTLTENLTKYGAPMRALGFDTKSAIAIFSQWEKAGVNTEIAFSGMKKAIGNWSKEGKDAREEFGKTLERIAEAPDIAEATEIAIETFGQKAGPDLADAIQNGRFEYSEFLSLLEDSTGTVENTYEATQDGFDKVKLAIQGAKADLGDYVGDLLSKYEPQITEFIETFTKKAEELLNWLTEHGPLIEGVLEGVGTAVAAAFVVTKVSNFITALRNVRTAFSKTKTAADALSENGGLLSGALVNPVSTGVVGGFLALAAGVWLADSAIEADIKKQHSLTEEQQALVEKCAAVDSAYKTSKEEREKSFSAIDAERGHLTDLVAEYNSLIDENGNVKQGYEERASFIIGELAQALGVERDDIQKNIDQNGKLSESIYQIIEAQKAEALLAASRDSYTEAIENRSEAMSNYQSALEELDKVEKDYEQTQADLATAQKELEYAYEAGNGTEMAMNAVQKATVANDEAKKSYETMKEAVEQAEEAYTGYNATIQNYEGLAAAAATGDMEEISEAALKLEKNFQTAETGTEESLRKQSEALKKEVSEMQQAVDSGMPGVTQSMVDAMASLSREADAELAKVSTAGKNRTDELAQRIQARKAALNKAGKELGEETVKGVEEGTAGIGKAGEKASLEYSGGVLLKEKESKQAGNEIATVAKDGAELVLAGFGSVGKLSGEEYLVSLKDRKNESKKSGNILATAAKDGTEMVLVGITNSGKTAGQSYSKAVSDTKNKKEATQSGEVLGNAAKDGTEMVLVGITGSGQMAGGNFNAGIASKNGEANSAGSTLASNAKSGTEGADTYSSGQNFAQGFINGIGSLVSSVANKAREMVRSAIAAAKAAQAEGSPSKLTYQSGVYFTQGYILGIASQEKLLIKTVQGMVTKVVSEMAKMSNFNFDTVGKNASAVFVERMKKDVDYMINKMQYQNELKLAEFDTEISRLEAERETSTANIQTAGDKEVAKLEKQLKKEQEDLKKTKTSLNEKSKSEQKAIQNDLDKYLSQLKKASEAKQKELQKKIDAEKDNDAKQRLKDEKDAVKKQYTEAQNSAKDSYKKQKENVAQYYKDMIAAAEDAEKKKEKSINKQIEKSEKATEAQIESEKKRYEGLIETQRKYQEAYQKASSQMISEFEDAVQEYQTKAQALIDDTINGITTRYNERYDELMDKQNNLITKMKSAGELFNISGAGVMRINDLQEQTKQLTDYANKLNKIKGKVSAELFDQIASYDMKEGTAFISQLLAMSERDLAAYNKAYTEKIQAAQKAGETIYKSDFDRVASDYKAEINQAFKTLPKQLEALGYESLKGFVTGLTTNTDYMSTEIKLFVKGMVDTFKTQLGIRSPSKVMFEIGEYTGEGLGDGLMSMLGYVKTTASEIASLISQPLDLMENIGDIRSSVSQSGYAPTGGVVNNYNLVQNNNSPKALSALETYQARRRQIALVKAFS